MSIIPVSIEIESWTGVVERTFRGGEAMVEAIIVA
jgi:hypothetical protein